MECLVGKQENFEVDSLINREPVKIVMQNRGYVIMFPGERDKAKQIAQCILNMLIYAKLAGSIFIFLSPQDAELKVR